MILMYIQTAKWRSSNVAQAIIELKEVCASYIPLAVEQWTDALFPLLNADVRIWLFYSNLVTMTSLVLHITAAPS